MFFLNIEYSAELCEVVLNNKNQCIIAKFYPALHIYIHIISMYKVNTINIETIHIIYKIDIHIMYEIYVLNDNLTAVCFGQL